MWEWAGFPLTPRGAPGLQQPGFLGPGIGQSTPPRVFCADPGAQSGLSSACVRASCSQRSHLHRRCSSVPFPCPRACHLDVLECGPSATSFFPCTPFSTRLLEQSLSKANLSMPLLGSETLVPWFYSQLRWGLCCHHPW